jgi:hypothetical protein
VDNTAARATDNGTAQSWLIAAHKRYDSGSSVAIKNDISVQEQPVTRQALIVSDSNCALRKTHSTERLSSPRMED